MERSLGIAAGWRAKVLVGALLLAALVPPAPAAAEQAPVRFIVGFHDLGEAQAQASAYEGAPVLKANRAIDFLVVETADPGFAARARADPAVRYVEEAPMLRWIDDHKATHAAAPGVASGGAGALLTPNDPRFGEMYGPQQVRVPEVWDTTLGTTDAAVCVIDTGVRSTHEDLTGVRWLGGYDFVNNDNNPADDNGHGTHVAGTAAGTINNGKGVAGMGNVGIYGVKVLNSAGSGTFDQVADGITWCADNGMPRTVLSLSLGGSGGSAALQDAVRYAYNTKGMLVVAAAGNDGPCSNCIGYPAKYAEVMAVTCTTSTEALCSFSSTGPEAELAAPGNSILSTCYGSDTQYCSKSGTSMSTPHASGVAALVWSHLGSLTAAQLRTRLQDTAVDKGSAGRDNSFGYGRVDAKCLLDGTTSCGGGGPPPPPPPPPGDCDTPGPDSFGYKCARITYDFRDISGTGTSLALGDDQVSGAVPIGFPFQFYGSAFSSAYVSSNGFVTFSAGSAHGCCQGQVVPDAAAPNHLVAAYWNDLYPPAGGSIKYQTLGTAPNRVFVVQWTGVPHYDFWFPGDPVTVQVQLHEGTNHAEVHFQDAPSDGTRHTTGIENSAGTVGLRYKAADFSETSVGVRFTPPGGAPPTTTASLAGTAGNNGWWRSAVTVTLTCAPAPGTTCSSTRYRVDGGAFQAYTGPFVVGGDGTRTVEYDSTGSNGAVEATRSTTVKVDTTPPVATASPACALPGDNGWCRGVVTVTTSATDATSGVASTTCTLDGAASACGSVQVSLQGSHAFQVVATDAAGNGATGNAGWKTDSVAPATSLASSCATPGNAGWCRTPSYGYDGAASDATSGLAPGQPACTRDGAAAACTGTVTGEGSHTVVLRARDAAGNEAERTLALGIDSVAPAVTASASCPAPGEAGWCLAAVALDAAATDATSGVLALACTVDGAARACTGTTGGEGAHAFEAAAEDAAGNRATASASYRVDTVPPVLLVTADCALPGTPGWCRSSSYGYQGLASDGGSGLAPGQPACRLDGVVAPCTGTAAGEGAHAVRVDARDVAGNAATRTLALAIDSVPPAVDAAHACTAPGDAGWCRGPVDATTAASDATSGLASTTCTLDGAAVPCGNRRVAAEGGHTLATRAVDVAGNEASASTSFRIDTVAPTATLATDCAQPGLAGWCRAPSYGYTGNSADATSGLAAGQPACTVDGAAAPCAGTVRGEARHTVALATRDAAGNPNAAQVALGIDSVPPQVAVLLDCALPGQQGWCRGAVTADPRASDATSGLASTTCTLDGAARPCAPARVEAQGDHAFALAATDAAGHGAQAAAAFRIDSVAPTTAAALAGTRGLAGWWVSAVQASLSCADPVPGSGCALTEADLDGMGWAAGTRVAIGADGVHDLRFRSADAAGNVAAPGALQVPVDRTPPEVQAGLSGLAGDNGWWRSAVDATLGCTDATSGPAPGTLRYRLDDAPERAYDGPVAITGDGQHTLLVRCSDVAGNEALRVVQVRIDATAPDGDVEVPRLALGRYFAEWHGFDATSGVARVEVQQLRFLGALGAAWKPVCVHDLAAAAGPVAGACAREPPLGQECYRVLLRDAAGNAFTGPGADLARWKELPGQLIQRCTVMASPQAGVLGDEAPAAPEPAVAVEATPPPAEVAAAVPARETLG